MNYRVDMHTHTSYTDGSADVFAMGKEAYEKGLVLFGLSDHAFACDPDGSNPFGIKEDRLDAYINDVYTLRDMYLGKMEVMCGLELENLSGFSYIDEFQDSQLNYLIGSTHNVYKDGVCIEVDHSEDYFRKAVATLYGGDYYGLVRDYYALEAKVVENTHCDIIGHFDLVTKFNEGGKLFDESSPSYREPALAAMETLAATGVPFEINTGAIARGCRTTPYPSTFLLKELNRMGGKVTLNSDAHDPLFIAFRFEECLKLIWECGFRKISVITPAGEQEFNLTE